MSEGSNDFEKRARESGPGVLGELVAFLAHNKKWWLTPIIVVLLLVLGASRASPFIYTLF